MGVFSASGAATIDIVLPVLNEAHCVERSVRTLAHHLSSCCPYDWQITVVDNGSIDDTWTIINRLSRADARIRALRMDRRGRGLALKEAWSTSSADVVAYMDIDLSTDLEALAGLIDPLVAGVADVSIGSRLAAGSRVERSYQREIISRIYNLITRLVLGFGIRDAQCGFKAVRTEVARKLIPDIQDDGWFFDTELLTLAWRHGFLINEVPVRWIEDPDSRVRVARTAIDDLRGIWRLSKKGDRFRAKGETQGRPELKATLEWSDREGRDRPADFDAHAALYRSSVDQSVAFTGRDSAFFAERKVQLLKALARRHVGELGRLRVLDVGCGTGTTDRFLVGVAGSLVGVDVSHEMLEIARKEVPGVEYELYDGEKLPYPDGSFDVVLAICVLHHVPPPRRREFVAELHRATRDGGLVVVFEHNPLNPLTRRAVSTCELDRGVTLASGRRVRSLLAETGADVLSETNFLFTPMGGRVGPAIDQLLSSVPAGGQFAVVARAVHV